MAQKESDEVPANTVVRGVPEGLPAPGSSAPTGSGRRFEAAERVGRAPNRAREVAGARTPRTSRALPPVATGARGATSDGEGHRDRPRHHELLRRGDGGRRAPGRSRTPRARAPRRRWSRSPTQGEKLVGQIAKRQAVTNPERTVFAVKRLIGRKLRRRGGPALPRDRALRDRGRRERRRLDPGRATSTARRRRSRRSSSPR